jgi:phenylalanyl-tRNA synthetase beta chain
VRLLNPLTEERNVMTTSLLPGLLEVVQRARRRGEPNTQVFTVASKFLSPLRELPDGEALSARPRSALDLNALPEERVSFAAVLAGERPAHLAKPEPLDVFDAKGIALELVHRLTRLEGTARLTDPNDATCRHLHPRGASCLMLDGVRVGSFGPLHPDVVDALDLGASVMVIEIDLVQVEAIGSRLVKYQPIPKLPAVTRDIALEASESIPAGDLLDTIRKSAGELCESVALFDVFQGDTLPPGHRSLAFRVVYRDPKAATNPENARTLTDTQVDQQHAQVVKAVAARGVTLRA